MKGVSGILLLVLFAGWAASQFLNHRPFPTYSLENMPDTEFSCREKVLGGYYADPDTQCQMFHICVKVAGIGVQDFRFLCPNGTAFDQDHQICAEWEDVDCDAATLYYSSDNFDLYRIGSGLESKAVRYGEDEETFALQRAETGDARLNREHQTQRVNQQKESTFRKSNNNNNNQNRASSSDREIFKGSSSSNFFNNRNGGKEPEDDEEDSGVPVNANQNNDREQKRKIIRKQNRKPLNGQNSNYNENQQEEGTQRPSRPTGFVNNFAGSYVPTTPKPVTSEAPNNNGRRFGGRQRQRPNNGQYDRQNNDQANTDEITTHGTSTLAPFRQTQQYNTINRHSTVNNGQYSTTTQAPKPTKEPENYPSNFPKKQTFPPTKHTENYPSTIPATNTQFKQTKQTQNYPSTVENTQTTQYETKKTTPFKQTDNYPTTFPPKPFQKSTQFNSQKPVDTFPTTFAPRTNAAYTQIAQQTAQYTNKHSSINTQTTQYNTNPSTTFNQQYDNTRNTNPQTTFVQQSSTPRTSPYTQYTPTVPKITTPYHPSTTPVSRSNRFDETQYDDGSYDQRYDNYDNNNRREEELIKTAHSTNIANSRNELAKTNKATTAPPPQKPYYESPRPFSASPATSKTTPQTVSSSTKAAPKPASGNKQEPAKKSTKKENVSYDYAYYDTNVGSEPEYDINTEIEKSPKKQ